MTPQEWSGSVRGYLAALCHLRSHGDRGAWSSRTPRSSGPDGSAEESRGRLSSEGMSKGIQHFLIVFDHAAGKISELVEFGEDSDKAVAAYSEKEKALESREIGER